MSASPAWGGACQQGCGREGGGRTQMTVRSPAFTTSPSACSFERAMSPVASNAAATASEHSLYAVCAARGTSAAQPRDAGV